MKKELPLKLDSEILNQLAPSQLVEIIIEQAKAIEQLKSGVSLFHHSYEQIIE